MRNALSHGTAQLPELDEAAGTTSVLGTTTPAAMAAGIDHGARGAVTHLIHEAIQQLGANARIVLAGGDAPWFASELPEAEVHGGTFTLQGIARAASAL
jgi:pantothenate kinase type III